MVVRQAKGDKMSVETDTGSLKARILEEMKMAMRAQAKERLGVIRLIQAEMKQQEVDKRIVLNDEQVLAILDKMIRQRKESIVQFEAGNRADLVAKESFEIQIIQEFLPEALSAEAVQVLITEAIQEVGASSIRDMAKVMAILKPKLQGRADLGEASSLIKNLLSG